tara:strand:- start:173 stop:352 length:180 start_codon:yes stop_codon:yes gene_type:complete
METAKYITVLDYEQGDVFQYPIETKWDMEKDDVIEALLKLGHNITNCKWMIHKNKPIIH